jgi:predicted amidophosphoribosyltransferase
MSVLTSILDLLFPPKCPFCERVLDRVGICPQCERELSWIPEAEVLREDVGDSCCAAPLWYEDLAREGILRFKFHGASASAEALGELLARCVAEQFPGRFDVVTWVSFG